MNASTRGLAASCCRAALPGCGGGSSSDDDVVAPSSPTVAAGAITGFASVVVNGVRFGDGGATITFNDQPGLASQLKASMGIEVEGSVQACPNAHAAPCERIAAHIRFGNGLEGPNTGLMVNDRFGVRVQGRHREVGRHARRADRSRSVADRQRGSGHQGSGGEADAARHRCRYRCGHALPRRAPRARAARRRSRSDLS